MTTLAQRLHSSRNITGTGSWLLRAGCHGTNDVLASRRAATLRPTTANDETDDEAEKNDAADDCHRYVIQTFVQFAAVHITVTITTTTIIIRQFRRQLCQSGRHFPVCGLRVSQPCSSTVDYTNLRNETPIVTNLLYICLFSWQHNRHRFP